MRNIFKIFFADVKRISTNVVAVVVILGLCILPSLYAWFNILSNWDPYGPSATRNLKIAVASDDEGVTILGNSVNVGSSVISALESNTTMGWVFTDTTDEAIDGVYDGSYYAALIIPENFTEDMISFLGGEVDHPDVARGPKCAMLTAGAVEVGRQHPALPGDYGWRHPSAAARQGRRISGFVLHAA